MALGMGQLRAWLQYLVIAAKEENKVVDDENLGVQIGDFEGAGVNLKGRNCREIRDDLVKQSAFLRSH